MKKVFQLKFAHSLLLVFFCALLSPVFTSCGGDDEPDDPTDPTDPTDFLIGTWRVQESIEYGYHEDYSFKKDGACAYKILDIESGQTHTSEASYIHYPDECQIKIFTPDEDIIWTYEKISDTRIAVTEGLADYALVLFKL